MRRYSNRPSRSFYRTPLLTDELPLDILPLILEGLSSRQDFHACTLVNKTFNRVATPLLYQRHPMRALIVHLGHSDLPFKPPKGKLQGEIAFVLEAELHTPSSSMLSEHLPCSPKGVNEVSPLHHPASTLLKRPQLAKYVRHITETGSVHRNLRSRYPTMMDTILRALTLCINLRSLTWTDDSSTTDDTLLSLIEAIRKHKHPLEKLTIRTHSDLGAEVWEQLNTLTGLRSISLWCMEGPPRVLQGWSEPLGPTLTHLELGVSVFPCPPAECAPATSIPTILTCLPNLRVLDTEYLPSFREPKVQSPDQMPVLASLTVRTNTIDTSGKLWSWIKDIIPNPGLERFKLHAFTMTGEIRSGSGAGTMVPRMFLLDLAKVHGDCLREFDIGNVELTMTDVRCVKASFQKLELLACAVAVPDVSAIHLMIQGAQNLHTFIFDVHWIPYAAQFGITFIRPSRVASNGGMTFTIEDAVDMMHTPENPNLRTIGIGKQQFVGKWVLVEGENGKGIPKFEVFTDVKTDLKWIP
ncbi:hypothetical protein NP233_g8428 [Leucocoprinus birnbaumii]|uniref:F-box domain-containing protein n=1 Tax=Leucocoprinus birnbaumii TaxID=56174 RepID=A0AAD5VN41_9AGAR|nr:hypothetical protein NP233_g8428 [Leucocoprinus birnbaumii]